MHPTFDLTGKIAVVTGANKGIGFGIAKCLASAGAIVIGTARDITHAESFKKEIEAEGSKADLITLDVLNLESIKIAFAVIKEKYGRIDILVNNAGVGANHPAEAVTEADWDEIMDVNTKGLFFCSQAAGKMMMEQKSGRIINISSQASVVAIRDHAVYCASKGAVNQLTKVLALEWAEKGITVNAVGPTFTYTPGTAERLDNPQYLKTVLDRIPMGRVATIDDVGGAVIYLASEAAGMVTGTVLLVDGGWTIH